MLDSKLTGLVLGGGGMRGAYEAGVLSGIVDVLGLGPGDPAPFHVFAGSSVGAINGAFLAANADRGDMNVGVLARHWASLHLPRTLRFRTRGLLGMLTGGREPATRRRDALSRSLLAPSFLERLIRDGIDWVGLHQNVRRGTVKAVLVAALEIASGRTTVFAELGSGTVLRPSNNPRRVARLGAITTEHVLASAAIPVLFPARRIGDRYYCDGGLRFNTPMAPAIRCGAERLVVISLKHELEPEGIPEDLETTTGYPSLVFLLGKLLNALLLDPVSYDLEILDRFNRLVDILERSLSPDELKEIERLMIETRGMAYRRIDTLTFTPSRDIGPIASEHVRLALDHPRRLSWLTRRFLESLQTRRSIGGGDLASHVLFDGVFARALIELGRSDVFARKEEVRRFFG